MTRNIIRFLPRPVAYSLLLAASLLAVLGGAPAAWAALDPPSGQAAAPTASTAVLTRVLRDWMAKYKIRQGSIVVRRHGLVVHRAGVGEDPEAPVLLASLSKAITGACVATLVRDGRLSFETPVATALAKFIARHGRPADPRLESVTIEQLLTHRAGFPNNADDGDVGSHAALDAWLANHKASSPPGTEYLRMLLATHLAHQPGTTFSYTNADYALLGAAIEEATGKSYEDYCRAAVLTPSGAAGTLDQDLAVLWAFGGWRMTGDNYLAFYEIFEPRSSPLGRGVIAWMSNPAGKTYGRTSFPAWYGLGVRLRNRGQGIEIWHTGSWSRRLPAPTRNSNTSTLAFRSPEGWSVFVHSTPLVGGNARNELLDQLIQAVRSIKNWN